MIVRKEVGKGELRALYKDASCGEGFSLLAEAAAGRAAMSNVALSRSAPTGIFIFRPDSLALVATSTLTCIVLL